jgi:hypothetical protein
VAKKGWFFNWFKRFGNLRIGAHHPWISGKIKLEGCDVFFEDELGNWCHKIGTKN